ncbi:MAG: methyltransferase domain-containing protein, partial [Halomonas sp.]
EEAIAAAQQEARELGNTNVVFEVRDLTDFDRTAEPAAFDLITTFDAVHDQADPPAVLRGIRRALAEDGVYLAQDIKGTSHHHTDRDHPIGPLLYTLSCMHCMTVSLARGGEGLGAMWGREKALDYFHTAGFSDIAVHELDHDFQNYWYVCRP